MNSLRDTSLVSSAKFKKKLLYNIAEESIPLFHRGLEIILGSMKNFRTTLMSISPKDAELYTDQKFRRHQSSKMKILAGNKFFLLNSLPAPLCSVLTEIVRLSYKICHEKPWQFCCLLFWSSYYGSSLPRMQTLKCYGIPIHVRSLCTEWAHPRTQSCSKMLLLERLQKCMLPKL